MMSLKLRGADSGEELDEDKAAEEDDDVAEAVAEAQDEHEYDADGVATSLSGSQSRE